NNRKYRRYAGFALWGLLAGLALWSDPLVAPFVALPGIFMLVYCWHERKSLAPFMIVLGFLVGFSPYLVFFATVPREQVTNRLLPFSANLQLISNHEQTPTVPLPQAAVVPGQQSANAATSTSAAQSTPDDQQGGPFAPITLRLLGLVAVAMPVFSGGTALCSIQADDAWPLSWQSSPQVLQCSAVHGVWGLGLILLWGGAVWLVMRRLRVYRQQTQVDEMGRRQATIQAARLTILAAAGLTVLIYGISTSPMLYPWSSSRYLIALNIATPGLLVVFWDLRDFRDLLKLLQNHTRFLQRLTMGGGVVTLVCVLGVLMQGTVTALSLQGAAQQADAREMQLITQLENAGIQQFYTDYWTCNRLAFESQEHLRCVVLDDQLRPGLDRDWPYRAQVYSDPKAAFVFRDNSSILRAFQQRIAGHEPAFARSEIGAYVVYRPV
ncbi:MAG: hypothetical protein J2P36_39715, partial [Ktedonobacteraceae bacterium]|nr:hypothetical protein [Ktedonobacteraceae bacterium]